MPLKNGTKAPEIDLESTSGDRFVLSKNMAGKPCIIYFYPKDFTPGCTEEACTFRDEFSEFRNLDVPVFGISRDSIKSHLKFKEQHNLPFELLSDPKGAVCKKYDALVPVIGIPKRLTYLIDQEGNIAASYQDMFGAANHISEMIKFLKDANN